MLLSSVNLCEENGVRLQDWTERQKTASHRIYNREIKASRDKTCGPDVKPDPNTADANLDVSMDNTKLMKPPSSFLPDLQTESAQVAYRFRCPGPGGFQCTLTGLVFVMDQEAELLYRTVQWDDSLLQSAGKMAAGPLFDIQSPEGAVCQLHLPHCETKDVWALDFLWRIWSSMRQISGQVLLFLQPPNPKTQRQSLNVLLLPSNVPLEEVSAKQQNSEYIQVPSKCKLIKDESYTVYCPEAYKIQPEKEDFDLDFGPNYHPMFEIRLPTNTEKVTITVRDQTNTDVWRHEVDLTGPGREIVQRSIPVEDNLPAEDRLLLARSQFINRVSEPVLDRLLDKLLERGVVNDDEMQSAGAKTGANKARDVIDTVRRKGTEASSVLISALCEVDPYLSRVLTLR
ncbi:NACHT, LRR and PYD domains-containing protein 1b allele 2-like protein [Lates japonicus]|uniref:NACHT, LRR and PYD domains-containing protein 1b allele 2-like protein n=1 Tax=Lates japonicus TaxID=270547 RepID=A0AAD3RJD2_LATJO|nr:NACHT, LRR and PYD domains-containing protein 1b allele 2-like protein [Lates japonicus]